MFQQIFAIIRNTFFESIRQPIMLVVLVAATLALILCNQLAAFTMEDDQRMFIDMGMATVFLSGALLASFIATNVLGREIENRTALTVISKPVSRPVFVVGKYLGVACALAVASLYMIFVFLLVEQHSVLQTVRDPVHLPVITFGLASAAIGLGAGIWCNYFYNKVFASTVICVTTPLAGLAYVLSLNFKPDFSVQPIAKAFKPDLWLGLIALSIAIMVLTAIAVAASTRLGQVMTLCITVGLFTMGMLSDWFFGRQLDAYREVWLNRAGEHGQTEEITVTQTVRMTSGEVNPIETKKRVSTVPLHEFATTSEQVEYGLCWAGYSILPNFQVFWLSDAITQEHVIPRRYIGVTALYGLFYIGGALALATALFQRREVG